MADARDKLLAEYILAPDPGEAPLPRAAVYRRLVRNNLLSAVEYAFSVTREVFGENAFKELFQEFLAAGGPTTSFYRDVPGDLAAWAVETERPNCDLVHWEWLKLQAERHPAELDDLAPPQPGMVRPNPTIQVGVYSRPVHEISADNEDPAPYEGPQALLVWRRPKTDEVEHLSVGILIARGLSIAAAAGAPVAVAEIASQLAEEAPELPRQEIFATLEAVCAELAERGGLVG